MYVSNGGYQQKKTRTTVFIFLHFALRESVLFIQSVLAVFNSIEMVHLFIVEIN